ncbi:MAG: GntP family permease [Chlorobi bacterium]|nr:GntP family permease [Chlorobiota bacterium]
MIMIAGLLLILAFIVLGTAKFKLHPFIVLLVSAVVMGFLSGMPSADVLSALTAGFGKTIGNIGIVIALGAVIGTFLEKSGATGVLAASVLHVVGKRKPALALNLTGFVVSIPVFCDSGFIILSPLNKALSRKTGVPLLFLAIAMATGLYATHVFVPPTPGPLAAAALLDADLGKVMLLGFIIAFPVSIAGYIWAGYISKRIDLPVEGGEEKIGVHDHPPGVLASLAPIVVPILLIALKSVAEYPSHPFGDAGMFRLFVFSGNPVIALFTGVLFAFGLTGTTGKMRYEWLSKGLLDAGIIILITGAGGAFGHILEVGGFGDRMGSSLAGLHLGIFLPFILAAILKSAQGSSTVSIITTAAVVAPLLGTLGLDTSTGKALAVLATGAGAMTVSHLNDSYFWVVTKFSHLDVRTALKAFTAATLFQGITAITLIWIMSLLLG